MEVVGIAVTAFEAAQIYSKGRLDDPNFGILALGLGLYCSGRLSSDELNRQRIKEELKLEGKVQRK